MAIAIAILVLEIKVPSDLRHLGPRSGAWVAGLFGVRDELLDDRWRVDRASQALQPAVAVMPFLPFPTAILAEALRTAEIAVVLNGATCVALVGVPKIAAAFRLVLAIPSVVLAGAHGRLLRWSRAT